SYDPTDPKAVNPGCPEGRNYRGQAFLSVRVLYAAPGARGKPIGVLNLTDRDGQDAFTAGVLNLGDASAQAIRHDAPDERLVTAASGIHAESAETPTEVLRRLEESLAEELASTEMFLTVFYAVVDAQAGRITFGNAGHAHAFLVSTRTGEATRLEATRPPLGLATAPGADVTRPWTRKDAILCLFTDGVAEALGGRGDRFGEERVLGHVARLRARPALEILESVHADLAGFTGGAAPTDDRTVVILKA